MKTMLAVLVAAVAAGGCSWGAQAHRAGASKECSRSRWAPIADTAAAAAGVTSFAYGMLIEPPPSDPESRRTAFIGPGSAAALVFTAAAISGYTWANECRRAPSDVARAAQR